MSVNMRLYDLNRTLILLMFTSTIKVVPTFTYSVEALHEFMDDSHDRSRFKTSIEQAIWNFALVLPGMLLWHYTTDNALVNVVPKVNALPDPPHDFIIPRKRSLDQLQMLFRKCKNENGKVNTIYVVGDPRTGKTELARQYGNFEFDRNRTSTVVHLNMTSETALRESLIKVIIEIDLKTTASSDEFVNYYKKLRKKTITDSLETLQNLLKKRPDWLIIVDDIKERNIIQRYKMLSRPRSGLWGTGRMIVTTRFWLTRYDSDHAQTFRTKGLDVEEAEKLLCLVAGGSPGKESGSHIKHIAYNHRKAPRDIVNVGFSMRKRRILDEKLRMTHNCSCKNYSCCPCIDGDIFFCPGP